MSILCNVILLFLCKFSSFSVFFCLKDHKDLCYYYHYCYDYNGYRTTSMLFRRYFVHSDVPYMQEHYFETTSVRTPIFEQLYRKKRNIARHINLHFKFTKKMLVEKLLHNINTHKVCGHDINNSTASQRSVISGSLPLLKTNVN